MKYIDYFAEVMISLLFSIIGLMLFMSVVGLVSHEFNYFAVFYILSFVFSIFKLKNWRVTLGVLLSLAALLAFLDDFGNVVSQMD